MSDPILERLAAMGLALPAPTRPPPGIVLPFAWVRIDGDRAYISGHGPTLPDGTLADPLGRVGSDVSLGEAQAAARLTALAMLASLHASLGSLDRIAAWLRVFGMVNCAPGFDHTPLVINGFSDPILSLYGPERGQHARSAVGMAELPFGIPVEIEAEVRLKA